MVTEHFKKLAFRYFRLAETKVDDAEAARLRLLAADIWEKGEAAESGTTQQQQQIQPKDDLSNS